MSRDIQNHSINPGVILFTRLTLKKCNHLNVKPIIFLIKKKRSDKKEKRVFFLSGDPSLASQAQFPCQECIAYLLGEKK